MAAAEPDRGLLDATVAVVTEHGWHGVTLERVAEQAGRSRVTLWRQGITREALLDGVLADVAADYRAIMWPVLTAGGTGRERLAKAVHALCDVIDRHLALMLATDLVFHREPTISFRDPFERFLRDGAEDGTLRAGDRIRDLADVVFNTIAWTYTHLRGRHSWSRDRALRMLLDLVLNGVAAPAAQQ